MSGRREEDAAKTAAAARKGAGANLPKRFYQAATIDQRANGFAVLLDGKSMRTPSRKPLVVPSRAIADAIAAEWSAQVALIDPATMPMTRLVNSTLDGVAGQEAEVAADAAKYAGSDLLCYRAHSPEALVMMQCMAWDPVLAWAESVHGWRFAKSVGVAYVTQPPKTLQDVSKTISRFDAFALAGLHAMTTLMGSVLLAVAVAQRHMTAEAAWAAAHVDEDFQIRQWGEDAEAAARRAFRWRDMQAAAMLVAGK